MILFTGPAVVIYAGYSLPGYYKYRLNLEKWGEQSSSYSATVYINLPDSRLFGENHIEVRAGKIISATNPWCPDCQLSEFEPLSVNGLFALVRKRCIFSWPASFCNLGYDDTFGYPVRIDQYCGFQATTCGPSITIGALTLSK
jgi:hypothetical protein